MFGHSQHIFLDLVLKACEIIRHVSGEVDVLLCRHFLHVKYLRHGPQEFQPPLPLLPDQGVPSVQQSSRGVLGDSEP